MTVMAPVNPVPAGFAGANRAGAEPASQTVRRRTSGAVSAAWLAGVLVALLVGCGTPAPSEPTEIGEVEAAPAGPVELPPPPRKGGRQMLRLGAGPATAAAPESEAFPRVRAVPRGAGRVASVNVQAQFVVADFTVNPAPPAGAYFVVYREGAQVGRVRISPWRRGGYVAADIMAGEAAVGDELRPD